MDKTPIHLTILRRGDVHIVDLAEVQAIIPRSETRVDGVFLNEIGDEIKRITNLVGPEFRRATQAGDVEAKRNPRVVRDLKNLGSLIFSHLLPQAARDRLRTSESSNLYLRLDDQLVHIPWELAFDGQQFLGMKFRVGRQIITHHKVVQAAPVRAVSDTLKVLIVSDPSETLKNVAKECEQLCEILDGIPSLEVRLIGGRGVKRIPLLAALRESDIVHFAGHSQFDEKNPENSGWLLYDGLLAASEISKLDQTPLLVFSNSCQAGATKDWQGEYLFEGQAFGLGSAFLLAGVPNYIGTFCVVHDEESRFLASEFYRRIVQGETIGQALLEARLATAEEMGLDRLTWASYMLYGDPGISLKGIQTAAFSPPPTTRPKAPEAPTAKESFEAPPKPQTSARPPGLVNQRSFAWISWGLFAVALLAVFAVLMSRSLSRTGSPVPGPGTPAGSKSEIRDREEIKPETIQPATPVKPVYSGKPKPSQELNEIRVEVERLNVALQQKEISVFLKILNKTPKELALVGGRSSPFMTDNQGSSYDFRESSGLKRWQYQRENWTYIPPAGEHVVSLRFSQWAANPKKDSLYSLSIEVVLVARDDLERTATGRLPDTARTVAIAIGGIGVQ